MKSASTKSGLYYLKDKKCRPIKCTRTGTTIGDYVETYYYSTPTALWCYTKQLSQDQVFQAKAYGQEESRLFVLNYRDDIEVYDMIEYSGTVYTVTRVDTQDDYNTELFVYVKLTPRGSTPTSVLPYPGS